MLNFDVLLLFSLDYLRLLSRYILLQLIGWHFVVSCHFKFIPEALCRLRILLLQILHLALNYLRSWPEQELKLGNLAVEDARFVVFYVVLKVGVVSETQLGLLLTPTSCFLFSAVITYVLVFVLHPLTALFCHHHF